MIRLMRQSGGSGRAQLWAVLVADGRVADFWLLGNRSGRDSEWRPNLYQRGRWACLAVKVADAAPYRGRVMSGDTWQTQARRKGRAVKVLDAAGGACGMMPVMPAPQPIHAAPGPDGFRVVRPGARYAVHHEGDERPGAWLPDGEALPKGWGDAFPEDEARSLLPFLRARGTAGRVAAEPTSKDGRLVARACKWLGVTAAALGERIGAHEAVLSRARSGELPEKHREAIKALLKSGAGKAT